MKKTETKHYIVKFNGVVYYLKSLKVVKAILSIEKQPVLIRTIKHN
jgi:hypothetical protein